MSIQDLLNRYAAGETNPVEIVRDVYRRIERSDAPNVWIHVIPEDDAVAMAEALGPMDPKKPLYGIPFAIKDNIDLAGTPTTAGCPAYAYTPSNSAGAVQQLIDAGAIPIGKTNLDQFATGLVGTRSPYGACSSVYGWEFISGGSSSGSAVAVAEGLVAFSLGTDTAGSGRVPAAFNNLVGLKPTRGLLSTRGVVPACRTLDCVSIFANTVEDAAIVLRAAKGFDPSDSYSRPEGQQRAWPEKIRFGVPSRDLLQFFGDSESEKLYFAALEKLEADGHTRVAIDFTPFRDAATLLYSGPWVAERYAAIRAFIESHPGKLYPVTEKIIGGASNLKAVDAFEAMYQLAAFARAAESELRKIDLMVLPTAGTIYRHEDVAREPVQLNTNLGYYTNSVNLLDLAALAIPAGFRPDGMPFGVTYVAPAWSDAALLQFASQEREYCPAGYVPLAVCGAHLTGQPLNWQLTQAGAFLIEATTTSADYRFYALKGTVPAKPGLVKTSEDGAAIEVEVWAVPENTFGRFVANVPPPLAIGSCTLKSNRTVKSFACEPIGIAGAEDITHLGGWRAFVKRG